MILPSGEIIREVTPTDEKPGALDRHGRCAGCHIYPEGNSGFHLPGCPCQTREEAIISGKYYWDEFLKAREKKDANWKRIRDYALAWEAKFHNVRQENNALRKKLRRYEQESEEPAS